MDIVLLDLLFPKIKLAIIMKAELSSEAAVVEGNLLAVCERHGRRAHSASDGGSHVAGRCGREFGAIPTVAVLKVVGAERLGLGGRGPG